MTAMEEVAVEAPELAGERADKARRIVVAMRDSVARRGAAGSTFDQVACEAGVSRGLLHYYFGSKERLLVEVVRCDCDIRLDLLDSALAGAHTAEDLIDALVRSLQDMVRRDPALVVLAFELFTLARRNEEIAIEMAEVGRRARRRVAAVLQSKEREGVLRLGDEPEAVAGVLLALADGLALRMLTEPGFDADATLRAGVTAARALLADEP